MHLIICNPHVWIPVRVTDLRQTSLNYVRLSRDIVQLRLILDESLSCRVSTFPVHWMLECREYPFNQLKGALFECWHYYDD